MEEKGQERGREGGGTAVPSKFSRLYWSALGVVSQVAFDEHTVLVFQLCQ